MTAEGLQGDNSQEDKSPEDSSQGAKAKDGFGWSKTGGEAFDSFIIEIQQIFKHYIRMAVKARGSAEKKANDVEVHEAWTAMHFPGKKKPWVNVFRAIGGLMTISGAITIGHSLQKGVTFIGPPIIGAPTIYVGEPWKLIIGCFLVIFGVLIEEVSLHKF